MTSKSKILFQGAEAVISLQGNYILKDRIRKTYRISEIDNKIRKQRTRAETKLLDKASQIINSAKPIVTENPYQIKMPLIKGKKLSESLDSFSLQKQKEICKKIGQGIANLHDKEIIHGDLTTSNMILVEKENKIYFIDFGLGFISEKIEDKAVDLHLLKQALDARHFKNAQVLFNEILSGYQDYKRSEEVLIRLKVVESRGRYKH